MSARRFERIALARLLLSGCAVMFAAVVFEYAQAQPGYVPPATPLPAPVFNPSNPSTVPQPPYGRSRPQRQARLQVMWLPRRRVNACRAHPLVLTERPSKKRARSIITEVASRESRGLIIAAPHLVFVSLLRSRPPSTRRRSCGGPAITIMHPANLSMGLRAGAVIRGIPGITGTEDRRGARAAPQTNGAASFHGA